jgi:molecular chaperone DnaJ
MPKQDPYEILGIERDATQDQARKNFRQLARQYHPDRNPGDKAAEAKFKEVEDAWTELEQILPRSAVPLEYPRVRPSRKSRMPM